jgi:hypothetical protein
MKDAPSEAGTTQPAVDPKPDRYGHSVAVAEGKPQPKVRNTVADAAPERFADADTDAEQTKSENVDKDTKSEQNGAPREKQTGEETVKKDPAKWEPPTWCKLPGHTSVRLEVTRDEKVKVVKIHDQRAYVIGRNKEMVDVVDLHDSTSRRHVALLHASKGSFIQDLGSSQGTFLNGKKLKPNRPTLLSEGATY